MIRVPPSSYFLRARAVNHCLAAIDLVPSGVEAAVFVDRDPGEHGAQEEIQLGRLLHASCSASMQTTNMRPSDSSAFYGALSMMSWAAAAATAATPSSMAGGRSVHYSCSAAAEGSLCFQGSLMRGFAKAASAGGKGGEIMDVMSTGKEPILSYSVLTDHPICSDRPSHLF